MMQQWHRSFASGAATTNTQSGSDLRASRMTASFRAMRIKHVFFCFYEARGDWPGFFSVRQSHALMQGMRHDALQIMADEPLALGSPRCHP